MLTSDGTDRRGAGATASGWRWLLLCLAPMLAGIIAAGPPEDDGAPGSEPAEAAVAEARAETPAPARAEAQAQARAEAQTQAQEREVPTTGGAGRDPAAPQADAPAEARGPACEPTPLSRKALAEALRDGHVRYFGVPPNPDRWSCAWAHCAFEQARGEAIYGNNLGHVTARGNAGRVCLRRHRERVAKGPDRWEEVDVWFRVFDSPAEGAAAYWHVLASSYNSVIARCDDGDARGAAQRLAEIGYFTGPEEPYVDGMGRLFVNARGVLIPKLLAAEAARAGSRVY